MSLRHRTQQASSTTAPSPRAPAIDPYLRLRVRCQAAKATRIAGKGSGSERQELRLKHASIREARARAQQVAARDLEANARLQSLNGYLESTSSLPALLRRAALGEDGRALEADKARHARRIQHERERIQAAQPVGDDAAGVARRDTARAKASLRGNA